MIGINYLVNLQPVVHDKNCPKTVENGAKFHQV